MTSAVGPRPRYLARFAHYGPGARLGPRTLGDFEFVWIVSGSARWRFEGPEGSVEHDLVPGSVVLARAGGCDRYAWDTRHPSSHGYLHFDWPDAPAASEQAGWPLVRQPPGSRPLLGLCDYLLTLSRVDDAASRRRSAEVLAVVVDVFLRGPLPAGSSTTGSPRLDTALRFARAAWERDGMRILTLDELAAAAEVTPGHLARAFGARFDGGLVGALEHVRLGHAATRLQRSEDPLSRIAEACGFADAYHFSRRFSRVYGVAPGGYRRRHGGDDPLAPLAAAGLLPVWDALGGLHPSPQS